jgi:uncharacterized membrane protein
MTLNEPDPYSAPRANLEIDASTTPDGFLGDPRSLPIGAGMDWLGAGWRSFALAPWPWIAIFILFAVIVLVASMLPLINIFANLLTVVLVGGIMLGCDAQNRGKPLDIAHLFAGFSRNAGGLVAVGALYLAGTLVIAFVIVGMMFAFFGGLGLWSGQSSSLDAATIGVAVVAMVGVALLLLIPLMMATYYAPALVAINGMGPIDAMVLSFRASARNFFVLLVFFIVVVLLSILAMLPLLLGLLVMYPVVMAANYAAYRDTFYAA